MTFDYSFLVYIRILIITTVICNAYIILKKIKVVKRTGEHNFTKDLTTHFEKLSNLKNF